MIYDFSDTTELKIGIVSDTHGEIDARVVALLADCAIKIHAGDIMGKQVLDSLQQGGGEVIAVRGNNDFPGAWDSQDREVVSKLPDEVRIKLPGGDVVVTHGHQHGGNKILHSHLRETFNDVRLIIYGHSHHLAHDQDATPWVVNPGAAGRTRTHGGPSCLILTVSHKQWHIEPVRFHDAEQPTNRPSFA